MTELLEHNQWKIWKDKRHSLCTSETQAELVPKLKDMDMNILTVILNIEVAIHFFPN